MCPHPFIKGTRSGRHREAYEGSSYHGRDYAKLTFSLPGLRIREVDFSAFPEIATSAETCKSDFFRWNILHGEGGVYADTDIIFSRPLRAAPFHSPSSSVCPPD